MADIFPQPRVSKNNQNTQLSYELPHRIYTSQVYPIKSPNGSTVIIYGHENGVRIIWRGGRPFKTPTRVPTPPAKTNGNNAIISLDSDDEDNSSKKFEDKPEFEDEEEETDPSRPFPGILQSLDLMFGTDILHIALLPASVVRVDGSIWKGIESLKEKIVFTAAGADNSLRLVTIPLLPPSPASLARNELRPKFISAQAGNGTWGENIIHLDGHQKPSNGLSMTVDFGGNAKDVARGESKSSGSTECGIIVASYSKEVTGLLVLFRIPVKSKVQRFEPFQTVYLTSPAKSISFNPSLSSPRSSQLLVADSTGTGRLYDYKLLSRSSEDPESPNAEQGTWILSLYASFPNNKSDASKSQVYASHAGFGRKSILDIQWISAGRAVIVLFDDGEWAIWDIEGVGPTASQGLLGRQGIKGGSISQYSLSGHLENASKSRTTASSQTVSKFAPMTPATRKANVPFAVQTPTGPLRGKISVLEIPSSSPTSASEESIVFWFGESYIVIPSLQKYWASNPNKAGVGSGSVFGSTPGPRILKLDNIDLRGERCSGITQIAKTQPATGLPSDIIILGEHRFTILFAGQQAREPMFRSSARLALSEKTTNGGELDVIGIEQALARMENGTPKRKLF